VPLISRWDGREEQNEAAAWLKQIRDRLCRCVEDWYPSERSIDELFTTLRIPHVAYFSFGEKLPILTHSLIDQDLPGYYYSKLADLLESLSDPFSKPDELLRPPARQIRYRRAYISCVMSEMRE
jgi:hypothetical protein